MTVIDPPFSKTTSAGSVGSKFGWKCTANMDIAIGEVTFTASGVTIAYIMDSTMTNILAQENIVSSVCDFGGYEISNGTTFVIAADDDGSSYSIFGSTSKVLPFPYEYTELDIIARHDGKTNDGIYNIDTVEVTEGTGGGGATDDTNFHGCNF